MTDETNATQTISNDDYLCATAEHIRNGEPIEWEYWLNRKQFSPQQAARLAFCIDPIVWKKRKCKQGQINKELRIKIQRCAEWLAEQNQEWTLPALVEALGKDFAPHGMKQAVWIDSAEKAQAQQLEEMLKTGRYTLSGAALILEKYVGLSEHTILEELKKFVASGDLLRYEPGKEIRRRTKVVRDFVDEFYWDDLNAVLPDIEERITWRFPEPKATSAEDVGNKQETPQADGVTRREILSHDWPLPPGAPLLENILDEIPKWVDDACKKVGKAGKGSHLWNPAILAVCLAIKTPHKRWAVGKGALTNFLRLNYSDYFEQWELAAKERL